MRFAHLILVILGTVACSPDTTDVLAQPLVDGGILADRTEDADFVAILLIRPGDAFTCGNHISRWMEWGRKNPGQFLLVFDRPPTEDEQKQLTLLRVRPDAVIAKSRARSRPLGPYEYIVQDNNVIASHQVEPGNPETPLLNAVEQGRGAELLQGRV